MRERPGGPGAESAAASTRRGQRGKAQAVPEEAGNFPTCGGKNIKTNGRQAPVPARLSPRPAQPAPLASLHRCPRPPGRPRRRLTAGIGAGTPRRLLPPQPPMPPRSQLTLPAPAAIVTLTETYPVHNHGNAHPSRALLPLLPRRSLGMSRGRRHGSHVCRGQQAGQADF